MSKIISISLCFVLALCLCGCFNKSADELKKEANELNKELERERRDTSNTIDRSLNKKMGGCVSGCSDNKPFIPKKH